MASQKHWSKKFRKRRICKSNGNFGNLGKRKKIICFFENGDMSQVRYLMDVPVCVILANSIVNICKNSLLKTVKRCKISDRTIC